MGVCRILLKNSTTTQNSIAARNEDNITPAQAAGAFGCEPSPRLGGIFLERELKGQPL